MVFIPFMLAALAASAQAGPISPSGIQIQPRAPAGGEPSYVVTCKKLENCEIYQDTNGKDQIRFKGGMEPDLQTFGQANNINERDGTATTEISISDKTLQWGCNTKPHDAIAKIGDLCPSGSGTCSTLDSKVTIPIQIVPRPGAVIADDTLKIVANGQYPKAQRDAMIRAVQEVAGMNVQATPKMPFMPGQPNPHSAPTLLTTQPIPKQCDMAEQTALISIIQYIDAKMQGFIHVEVASENAEKAGLCGTWKGVDEIAQGWAGVIPVVGPAIAAIFGTVSGSCDL